MRRAGILLVLAALLLGGLGTGRPASARSAVLTRTLPLARGADRPLPTTVWYPAVLTGRHPIVLFSHGLGGSPRQFTALAAGWAEAGYVVAAPAYPHTSAGVPVDRGDVADQPADAEYVLSRVEALDRADGDVFAGHLATDRVAAVGFSAGGTTTLGLFHARHRPELRAGVSIAGRRPPAPFGGRAARLLLVHGDRDPVVPIEAGRAAYAEVPWTRRFVVIHGAGHGEYLQPGDPRYARVSARILAFLTRTVPCGCPA